MQWLLFLETGALLLGCRSSITIDVLLTTMFKYTPSGLLCLILILMLFLAVYTVLAVL